MSLAKLPLRLASVMALRDKTWVGASVFDSTIAPIDQKLANENGIPILIVYTDDTHATGSGANLADLTAFMPTVDLTFHVAVATAIETNAAGGVVTIAHSDAGFEAQLDIVEAQIVRVLQKDPGPWGDLFRAFAIRTGERRSRRGASARKGLRFAAREIIIPVEAVPDPIGTPDEYPWNIAVDLFRATPALDDFAKILGDFCDWQPSDPEWRRDLGNLGFDRDRAQALGFVSADGEEIVFS